MARMCSPRLGCHYLLALWITLPIPFFLPRHTLRTDMDCEVLRFESKSDRSVSLGSTLQSRFEAFRRGLRSSKRKTTSPLEVPQPPPVDPTNFGEYVDRLTEYFTELKESDPGLVADTIQSLQSEIALRTALIQTLKDTMHGDQDMVSASVNDIREVDLEHDPTAETVQQLLMRHMSKVKGKYDESFDSPGSGSEHSRGSGARSLASRSDDALKISLAATVTASVLGSIWLAQHL